MFEKEAEDWVIDRVCKDCSRYKKCKSKECCTCKECSKEKWQYGAEFGYSKANEWHYVKDEGIPKVEGHYLVCLRNKDKDVFDCWIHYDKDVGWYSMKVRMKDIYAWKEIVLPELEESESC